MRVGLSAPSEVRCEGSVQGFGLKLQRFGFPIQQFLHFVCQANFTSDAADWKVSPVQEQNLVQSFLVLLTTHLDSGYKDVG